MIGIIGRNGAGKSTLLKVMSRITEPTSGRVVIRGRVSSLLEVGTGFHPELTGRENVYMNGTILGMTKREIDRKFDEIVDFSGVEKFLDTPTKRYSSGMKVRLAFAVAAHLEPEILIVDEVLAVGDAEFQAKCIGKMRNVADGGRAVVFVSHNMAAVGNLCRSCIVMKDGMLHRQGEPSAMIESHLTEFVTTNFRTLAGTRDPHCVEFIESVEINGMGQDGVARALVGQSLDIKINYTANESLRYPRFGVVVETVAGEKVAFLHSYDQHGPLEETPKSGSVTCSVPGLPLCPGVYLLSFSCWLPDKRHDFLKQAVRLEVTEADFYGTGNLPPSQYGNVLLNASWNVSEQALNHSNINS